MKNPKSEIRNPNTRNVLAWGSLFSPCIHRSRPGKRSPRSLGCLLCNSRSGSASGLAQSKTRRQLVALFGLLLLSLAICPRASAQSYSIDWHKIAGGGGTSTGGVYTVSGTIGQQDATTPGAMAGGNYSLTGGFWSLIAVVQTPGAPWLTVTPTPTNTVILSWPASAQGWVLEHTSTLTSPSAPWPQIPPPYPNNAGTNSVVVTNRPPANQFFRLHKP